MQQVCIPRVYRGTRGLWMRLMRVRASVRRSVVVFFHHHTTVCPWPVSVSPPPPPSRAQKNSSWFGRTGTGGKTRACDRVRRWLVRARAHPTRPSTTRPPNSDLVRTASHVSRRPVDRDRATPHSPSMRLPPCSPRGASVYRSLSDNNIFFF